MKNNENKKRGKRLLRNILATVSAFTVALGAVPLPYIVTEAAAVNEITLTNTEGKYSVEMESTSPYIIRCISPLMTVRNIFPKQMVSR